MDDSLPFTYKDCNICLNEIKIEDNVTNTPCNHLFHRDCLNKLINSNLCKNGKYSCPCCRTVINYLKPQFDKSILNRNYLKIKYGNELSKLQKINLTGN
jgi:SUMO ligase MMS21 Smc5/6 complex component